jgi:4-azaleucine resistance transporter AzlC
VRPDSLSAASSSVGPVHDSFRAGIRLGIPFAVVAFVLAMSFGVLARHAGFSALQALVTSAIIFAGSAQFAVLAVLASGGTAVAAIVAGTLMNGRYLAMGTALAPSLPGGPLARALQGQAMVDSSWAVANRGDGTFDRWLLFGTTLPQYAGWLLGTVVGAFSGDLLGDTDRFGLDAVFPTFFVAILITELRNPRSRVVALLGGAIALALAPFTPAGVPILAAAVAAILGLRR